MDAVKRAGEMMLIPMNRLPRMALEYAQHLNLRYGMCGEVYVTAFAAYAQCVEGLRCNDALYRVGPDGQKWFADACALGIENRGVRFRERPREPS